jgi:hypothetical protein
MPKTVTAFIALLLLTLTNCGVTGSAQGGATDNANFGHVRVGVPF